MTIRSLAALWACKLIHFGIRRLHRGGTAKPGEIALKICPDLLRHLAKNTYTVAITGTNGKTTSSRMVEHAFEELGLDYLANRSGANLISGITTEFALNCNLLGKCSKKYAVIECDEAASRRTFGQLKPKVVVVTNLFRDQLDRYGEVTHTLENVREGIKSVPEAMLCLNADCSLTSSLADDLPNPVMFFGIDESAGAKGEKSELSDATHCIRCKTEYEYDYITYGHLGAFRCPKCGYHRHDTFCGVTGFDSLDADGSTVTMHIGSDVRQVRVNLPAMYNIYNAAGAITAVAAAGFGTDEAVDAVGSFKCGFGRMENFDIGTRGARMMLVKNPAGCNQVLDFLGNLTEPFDLVVCLNDNGADGRDVSWIWDVDFEKLADMDGKVNSVTVGGIRAADMQMRIKYAGVAPEKLHLEQDYEALADLMSKMEKPIFVIPTYTSMLDFRAVLIKRCGGTDFWEG